MATEAVEARGRAVARSAARAAERFPERVAIRRRQEEIIPLGQSARPAGRHPFARRA
jgi:hypothetical protein